MLVYSARAFWIGAIMPERPDVIIGSTPHPFASLTAYLLSILKGARFFFEVRDLWPLTLVNFGRLTEHGPVTWALRVLEKYLFARAEKVIMVWPRVDEYAATLGIRREKFVWIPQCVDQSRYTGLTPYNGEVSERFTVMYLGAHIQAHALDVILQAAKLQRETDRENVRFVFVGGGQEKPRLIQLSRTWGLKNVEFRGVVPRRELFKVMGEADAFVLSLRDLPLYKYGISLNKLCDYMISGRPIIFAGRPAYNPVLEANCGLVIPPENPGALVQAIKKLKEMRAEERVLMGENGQRYVQEHHDVRVLAERLENVLKSG